MAPSLGTLASRWYTTSAQRPEISDHQSGHSYVWYVWIWDGGHYGGNLTAFGY